MTASRVSTDLVERVAAGDREEALDAKAAPSSTTC
jgi:hypothetical protein